MAITSRELRLVNDVRSNKPMLATFNILKGARTAQILANTGFDAIAYTCPGNIGDSDMHDQVLAIASSGVSPLVRVRGSTIDVIKRAFDTGTHGIIVTMTNTAAQAKEIVSCAKFPLVGVRGQDGLWANIEFGFANPGEYVAAANDLVVVMVQNETREGMENVDTIAEVDEIGQWQVPRASRNSANNGCNRCAPRWTAIDSVLKVAKRNNKNVGFVVRDGADAKAAKERRFDLIAINADRRALQVWYASELAKMGFRS